MLCPAALQGGDEAGCGAENDMIHGPANELEEGQDPDDAEQRAGHGGPDPFIDIQPQQLQVAAARHNNVLGLGC